jgi:hypothetical protein
MSSGDGGGFLDSVAEASDDDQHGQCSTVNDYSLSQHKLPLRNDYIWNPYEVYSRYIWNPVPLDRIWQIGTYLHVLVHIST